MYLIHMIVKCIYDVYDTWYMLYFSLRYIKIIHKISINFIILYLQQLSVLELRKFPNIKFIYIYLVLLKNVQAINKTT